MDKIKLHEACLQQQKEVVENFESRLKVLKADANANKHSASQTEERMAGKVDMLRNYEKELTFSRMELSSLQSINPTIAHTIVEQGAVVITNKLNFYISISLDKIEIEGATFIGISAKAPIFSAMENKRKGEPFKYNETTYAILEIY
ncbi:MAG: hypothetical protein KJ578_12840 [Bacteroidetes bacterium]|nr:hypothetical protein [Bacteroidota bacterium]MBU1578990.1 hypothetical protein [Bacteroidota bacterium]MBU2465009.1 hypothetical protein [Bacteroidota bacterium]MBU2558656.1 hypothetical protein [Bacteroidota bacterium]